MKRILTSVVAVLAALAVQAQDPDFHIYLCFGQSNMEGNAKIEEQDMQGISDRFRKDNLHFDAAGYRELGRRYGCRMLQLLGYDNF